MALYNERKFQILDFIFENDFVTSREVSNGLDLEVHNARTLLKNYFLQGLLSRKTEGFSKVYSITKKGFGRLEWLAETM